MATTRPRTRELLVLLEVEHVQLHALDSADPDRERAARACVTRGWMTRDGSSYRLTGLGLATIDSAMRAVRRHARTSAPQRLAR